MNAPRKLSNYSPIVAGFVPEVFRGGFCDRRDIRVVRVARCGALASSRGSQQVQRCGQRGATKHPSVSGQHVHSFPKAAS